MECMANGLSEMSVTTNTGKAERPHEVRNYVFLSAIAIFQYTM